MLPFIYSAAMRLLLHTAVPARAHSPTCCRDIHVFLWRNHKHMNNVFRLVNPVYNLDTYIFRVNVFTKQAEYEKRISYYFPRFAYSTCSM